MINFLHIFFSFLILLILTPQTLEYLEHNAVLKFFHETGFFANYGETIKFLTFLTWFSIFIYIFFCLL